MKIFAFSNAKFRERLAGATDARRFSFSLYKGKLCGLRLLFLLLASDHDQGEEREHHPSFQKSLRLYRQQVGSRPSADAVPTLWNSHLLLRHRVSGFFSPPKDMHAMLTGYSKQSVKDFPFNKLRTNPARQGRE